MSDKKSVSIRSFVKREYLTGVDEPEDASNITKGFLYRKKYDIHEKEVVCEGSHVIYLHLSEYRQYVIGNIRLVGATDVFFGNRPNPNSCTIRVNVPNKPFDLNSLQEHECPILPLPMASKQRWYLHFNLKRDFSLLSMDIVYIRIPLSEMCQVRDNCILTFVDSTGKLFECENGEIVCKE